MDVRLHTSIIEDTETDAYDQVYYFYSYGTAAWMGETQPPG